MNTWYMATFVGKDRSGIVAKITKVLFKGGCNLGEASMTRLGGNFTIMMMVSFDGPQEGLEKFIDPVCKDFDLRFHVDKINGELHKHSEPDVLIRVHGADRAGIVAAATGALAEAGLNILNLETDVGGKEDRPVYVMHLEGIAENGIDGLEKALEVLEAEQGVQTHINPIDTLIG